MQAHNEELASNINSILNRLLSKNPIHPEATSFQIPANLDSQHEIYQRILNNLCDILSIDQATREQDRREHPHYYPLLKKYLAQIYIHSQTHRDNDSDDLKNQLLVLAKNARLFQLIINYLHRYFLFGIAEPLLNLQLIDNKKITHLSESLYQHLALFIAKQPDDKNKEQQLTLLVTNITDLADQLKVTPNGNEYLDICKTILNDVFILIKEKHVVSDNEHILPATLCVAMSNQFSKFIEAKIKILDYPETISLLDKLKPNEKSENTPDDDLLETSFITKKLAMSTHLPPNEIKELRSRTRNHLERLDRIITDLQLAVTHYHSPLAGSNETISKAQNLLNTLNAIKETILHEWCIYLTRNKSQTGEFGYVNPYHHLFDLNQTVSANEDHDVIYLKTLCYQELARELRLLAKKNLMEIENELKNLLKPPFISRINELRFGNQNNDANSENKILASLTEIKMVLSKVAAKQPYPLENFHDLVRDITNVYNENLYGGSALGSRLTQLKHLYVTQIASVYSLFNRHHTMIEFLSTTTPSENEISFHEKLYHAMSLKENHRQIKKAEKNCHSRLIRFLEWFSYPNNNFEYGQIQGIFKTLKGSQFLSTQKYSGLLDQLSLSIYKLRTKPNSYIDRHRADSLERLCYDLITTHCLNHQGALPLNFTVEQLMSIRQIVFAINKSDNKKAATLSHLLMQRIQSLQESPENGNRLLLQPKKQENSTQPFGPYHYAAKEAIKIDTFKKAFIRIMTSHTIAQYAISSGQLQTMPGALTQTAALSENTYVPVGGYVYNAAWLFDQKRDQSHAQSAIKNMLPLSQWMALIENNLAPKLAQIFYQQIINMKNFNDIERFAEFCQTRMFAALKQGRQDWAEGLNDERFLIAAIFKMQNKLSSLPFRTDHYHQQNDSSLFGNSNFQKMVGSVAFIVKGLEGDTPSTDVYLGGKPIQQSKKVAPTHQNQIKKTIQKYGVIDLSNSTDSFFASQLAKDTSRVNFPSSDPVFQNKFHHTHKTLGDFLQEKQAELRYPMI